MAKPNQARRPSRRSSQWVVVLAATLAACAAAPMPLEQLIDETAEYRKSLSDRYLLLVGKSSSMGWMTTPAKIQRKLGGLRGWELHYAPKDFYLLPTLVPEDPSMSMDMLLEAQEVVADELPEWMTATPLAAAERRAILENMKATLHADEATVHRKTQAWLERWANPLLAMAAKDSLQFIEFPEDHGLSVMGGTYCLSGEFKILEQGNLEVVLWGVTPGTGWATAVIDATTRAVTISYD